MTYNQFTMLACLVVASIAIYWIVTDLMTDARIEAFINWVRRKINR